MKTIELVAITSNSDTTEGRGHTIIHGYAVDESTARAIVYDKRFAKFCIMGLQTPGDYKYMVKPATIKIFDSTDDFFDNTDDAIRKRALAKLSPEERRVLKLF